MNVKPVDKTSLFFCFTGRGFPKSSSNDVPTKIQKPAGCSLHFLFRDHQFLEEGVIFVFPPEDLFESLIRGSDAVITYQPLMHTQDGFFLSLFRSFPLEPHRSIWNFDIARLPKL